MAIRRGSVLRFRRRLDEGKRRERVAGTKTFMEQLPSWRKWQAGY